MLRGWVFYMYNRDGHALQAMDKGMIMVGGSSVVRREWEMLGEGVWWGRDGAMDRKMGNGKRRY